MTTYANPETIEVDRQEIRNAREGLLVLAVVALGTPIVWVVGTPIYIMTGGEVKVPDFVLLPFMAGLCTIFAIMILIGIGYCTFFALHPMPENDPELSRNINSAREGFKGLAVGTVIMMGIWAIGLIILLIFGQKEIFNITSAFIFLPAGTGMLTCLVSGVIIVIIRAIWIACQNLPESVQTIEIQSN